MKLIRYPHPLQQIREWESVFGDPFRVFAPLLIAPSGPARGDSVRRGAVPGVDWFEDESHFHARVEVPGVKREHLRLDAEEGVLRLTHEVPASGGGEGVTAPVTRAEFVLRCPEGIRTDGIEARLADGILHLSIPKEEVRKPVNIEVR